MPKSYLNNEEKEIVIEGSCPKCQYVNQFIIEYLFHGGKLYIEYSCDRCDLIKNIKVDLDSQIMLSSLSYSERKIIKKVLRKDDKDE